MMRLGQAAGVAYVKLAALEKPLYKTSMTQLHITDYYT
jgi:hypothetical protein